MENKDENSNWFNEVYEISRIPDSFPRNEMLNKMKEVNQSKYIISTDTSRYKDNFAYCFGRKVNGVFEVLQTKTIKNKIEFKEEVKNLAKYFNAVILEEEK